jgi:hypothetical protein
VALVPGMIVKVRCVVTTVDVPVGSCAIRLIDNNGAPITAAVTVLQSLVEVVEMPVAVNDVLRETSSGVTAVVQWVDPANPLRWSPSATGQLDRLTTGWQKIGTFTP